MPDDAKRTAKRYETRRTPDCASARNLSRRGFLGAGAFLGLAAMALPAERAFAWSSWTNATSPVLKGVGMGDCIHEDLVQISYARMLRNHASDTTTESLLNPWAGTIDSEDARYATIAGDIVDIGKGKKFASADDLAVRLFRENLAYLRIGSYWNDAAANTLVDFGSSCWYAHSVPEFSGKDHYEGAWDVGQHIAETNEQNEGNLVWSLDALVQFTMNDRNNFIHGMLSSTASHKAHLKQSDVKKFTLQWLCVAYEYARTGQVTATEDVTQEQAQKIFKGFIDTYGQLSENEHGMSTSLAIGSSEASIKLPRRRLRLRALGMMCHTMEDLWCPAHTCRTYHEGGSVPHNSILAFCNYKLQNGNQKPMYGYHIPFDRYAVSDSSNSTNWREALTRGDKVYAGTEKLANVIDDSMSCLDAADTYFNTLGMNETITCITKLLEFMYYGTAWDDGVRQWVDAEIMPTHFDGNGESLICAAGRRSLYTPTYLIAPITSMRRAYRKAGLSANYNAVLAEAKAYDAWQRGAHIFYSGKYNKSQSKYVTTGHEGNSIWDDSVGESRLIALLEELHEGYGNLSSDKQRNLLARIGCNGCHDMVSAIGMIGGMLQEFNIDLRGDLRPSNDEVMAQVEEVRSFFESGLADDTGKVKPQALTAQSLLMAGVAYADEGGADFKTSNMALEDSLGFDDGSYLIAVRDMNSLETSVMIVPDHTPGKDKLEEEGVANLSITYALQVEFEGDLDYRYVVTSIDYADMQENVYLVTGTVKSVSSDAKSLVLDLNGISELELNVREGASDVPPKGAYICARYSFGNNGLDLVDFDELDAPGELVKVTLPVAKVSGSSLLLLANESDTEEGDRDYLQVDYGAADIRSLPQEGYYATVYYHDEAYGNVVGASVVSTASESSGLAGMSTQSADDEMNDSATPGYLELGDEYDDLNYDGEVFHVANVIAGADEPVDDTPSGADVNPAAPNAGNAKSTSSPVAKTGDHLAGVGSVLGVAAVAGAAFAAYSARRVANEQANQEENWPDS